jgi:Fe-Mn family superoxide dismutase
MENKKVITLKHILTELKQPKFKRLPLSYGLSDLSPIIDAETMQEHYTKHYKGYTDKFNAACDEFNYASDKHGLMERAIDICKKHYKKDVIRNNGGGYINHMLYFENMTPDYKAPSAKLKAMIADAFGSFAEFKDQFKQAGLDRFGSGWVWLCNDNGKLEICSTANQDNPYIDSGCSGTPILAMDVWEHAYYLKHRSKRASYINDFFRVVDWGVVETRL